MSPYYAWLNTQEITEIVVPIVIVLILLVIGGAIAFFYYRRTQQLDNIEVVLNEPDYQDLAFASEENRPNYIMPDDGYDQFVQTLFNYDNKTLFRTFAASLSSSDLDTAAKHVVYVAASVNCTLDFLLDVIDVEIQKCGLYFFNYVFKIFRICQYNI